MEAGSVVLERESGRRRSRLEGAEPPAAGRRMKGQGVLAATGRTAFDLPEDVVWLDTAHQGPLPRRAARAASRALGWKLDPSRLPDAEFFEAPERLRGLLASLLGSSPEELVIGDSASHGLHLLAEGLDLTTKDEVVVVEDDFPATVLPWLPLRERGIQVRMLARRAGLTLEAISEALTPRTQVLCVTWVDSFSGHVLPVEALGRLCRRREVLLILNATQGVGVRPLAVGPSGAHAVCSSGYKWLCGPYGTGFCWITADLLPRLSSRRRYWLPRARAGGLEGLAGVLDAPAPAGARQHDTFGTASFFNVLPWIAALEYLGDIGIERLAAHNRSLVSSLRRAVADAGYTVHSREGRSSPFLVYSLPAGQDPAAHVERLRGEGIHVSVRKGRLRVSPHIHNDEEDVSRFRAALARCRRDMA